MNIEKAERAKQQWKKEMELRRRATDRDRSAGPRAHREEDNDRLQWPLLHSNRANVGAVVDFRAQLHGREVECKT